MRWDDNAKHDLNVMKINHWKKQAESRNWWKRIIKQAKTHRVVAPKKKKTKKKKKEKKKTSRTKERKKERKKEETLLLPSSAQMSASARYTQIPSVCAVPQMWETKFHTNITQHTKLRFFTITPCMEQSKCNKYKRVTGQCMWLQSLDL